MTKVLISWMALQNDFVADKNKVNPEGPNALVHKHFFNYDYHLLLSAASGRPEETRFEFLVNHLNRTYKHDVRTMYMNVRDVINLKEIQTKIDSLLLEHRNNEIEIFISPGTPTMQVAWHLAHLELGLKTKLFQLRPGRFTKTKEPEKVYIDFERSTMTSGLIIQEALSDVQGDSIIKITKSIKPVYDLASKVAATDHVTVLILGETGTGKEQLARFIHKQSARSNGPFVAVNCAALSDQLLESRLFGYVKGAFTDAKEDKSGLFAEANGGTIFLDEIGDISSYMQQVLLRVLQEKKITKIGSSKEERIDVRIISATNRDLEKSSRLGTFRLDLYFRLAVVELTLPALKTIGIKEIEEIFDFIVWKKQKEFNKPEPKFSKAIRNKLFCYPFPGNVRELENTIERIYAVVEGEVKDEHLPKKFSDVPTEYSLKLRDVENNHIQKVYEMCGKNLLQTTKILGISYNTLRSKLARHE
jgi:transcriptional regulator with PAS, ATPase and Fis domain